MSLFEELKPLDVDIDDAMERLMNKSAIYEKMLKMFPSAAREVEVLPCLESGDLEAAVANAHKLKGMTGNVSFTTLYQGYSEIVELLRQNDPREARKRLDEILPLQEKIVICIEKYI